MKIEQNYLLEAFVNAFNCEFITKDKLDEELAIFKSQLNSWKSEYNELKRNNNHSLHTKNSWQTPKKPHTLTL